MTVTGLLELAGAILVLVPRLAYIGAGLLTCVMVGAIFSHLTHGQAAMMGPALVLLILALVVGTLRGWGAPSTTAGCGSLRGASHLGTFGRWGPTSGAI